MRQCFILLIAVFSFIFLIIGINDVNNRKSEVSQVFQDKIFFNMIIIKDS